MKLKKSINNYSKWLYNSNIYKNGAVFSSYNIKNNSYDFIYHEITGYSLSVSSLLYKWTKNEKYLKYANKTFEYLKNNLTNIKDNIYAISFSPEKNNIFYSFDNSIILQGLIDYYNISKADDILYIIEKITNFLINFMQKEDGSFFSTYNKDTNYLGANTDYFDGDFGCLHIKHLISLLKSNELLKKDNIIKHCIKLYNWGKELQHKSGCFIINKRKNSIFTHAHCYATEGLIYASKFPELFPDSQKMVINSANWLLKNQNKDGSMYKDYIPEMNFKDKLYHFRYGKKTCDATSQSIRIFLYAYYITKNNTFKKAAFKASKFIITSQLKSKNISINGASKYHIYGFLKNYTPDIYSWCSQFSLCCLYLLLKINRKNNLNMLINEII